MEGLNKNILPWGVTDWDILINQLGNRHEILRRRCRRCLRKNNNLCVKFMLEFTGLTRNETILRENRYLIHPLW
jgi:hypothetical protein